MRSIVLREVVLNATEGAVPDLEPEVKMAVWVQYRPALSAANRGVLQDLHVLYLFERSVKTGSRDNDTLGKWLGCREIVPAEPDSV